MDIKDFEKLKKESVGHLLIKAARVYNEFAFNKVKEKMSFPHLRPSHLQLFAHIPFNGITVVELAKKMNISKQAVSKSIKELIDEEYKKLSLVHSFRMSTLQYKTAKIAN